MRWMEEWKSGRVEGWKDFVGWVEVRNPTRMDE